MTSLAPPLSSPGFDRFGLSAERQAAFLRADRQSRRVRWLRRALPALGVGLFALVIVTSILTRIEIHLRVGDIDITANGLAMDSPHLSGSDGNGRHYDVTARLAVQDLENPKVIRLNDIRASVTQASGERADFVAAGGVYDAGAQTLVLDTSITIRSSTGASADLSRAEIDLATGEVVSDAPVAFSSSLGAIKADGMSVNKKNGSVTFEGGVKMTVDPSGLQSATPSSSGPTTAEEPRP